MKKLMICLGLVLSISGVVNAQDCCSADTKTDCCSSEKKHDCCCGDKKSDCCSSHACSTEKMDNIDKMKKDMKDMKITLEEKAADLKKEISEDKNIKEIKTKAQKKVKKVVNEIKNSTTKQN